MLFERDDYFTELTLEFDCLIADVIDKLQESGRWDIEVTDKKNNNKIYLDGHLSNFLDRYWNYYLWFEGSLERKESKTVFHAQFPSSVFMAKWPYIGFILLLYVMFLISLIPLFTTPTNVENPPIIARISVMVIFNLIGGSMFLVVCLLFHKFTMAFLQQRAEYLKEDLISQLSALKRYDQ